MKPRTRSRMPASIGSNQASPANGAVLPGSVLVLSCSMAWSPPALQRRLWLVEQAGDYATPLFHHFRDATYGDLYPLLFVLAMLVVRPSGLFGEARADVR